MENHDHPLDANNFLVLRNFIEPERAKNLGLLYKKQDREKNPLVKFHYDPDESAYAVYNHKPFLELLCEKINVISDLLGEPVFPTYCYSRVYKKGSTLKRHTDRKECEVSVTLHLFGDYQWPISIKTPDGEEVSVILNPGDALVYKGIDAEHWREPFGGSWYAQVFLHYVKSRGKHSDRYFDIEKSSSKYNIDHNDSIIDSDTDALKKYIMVFDNIIPDELCDRILDEYSNSLDFQKTYVGDDISKRIDDNIRTCTSITISDPKIIHKNEEVRKKIDRDIFDVVQQSLFTYTEVHPNCDFKTDDGFILLSYKTGQFYTEHTDGGIKNRVLTLILILNNDYEGGKLQFFSGKYVPKLKKGSLVLFPSNFMFPHEVTKVESGTRYSIVCWVSG
jgi:hypothetical protein